MNARVLVAYGSKHGGTAEIAERIGEVIRDAGLSVDVLPAGESGDPAAYDAVVLGSALYFGRWRGPAARYLKRHQALLAEKPTWLFSSGPIEEGDPQETAEGWGFPKALQPIAEAIAPVDNALFHGVIQPEKLAPIARWMFKMGDAPVGDHRDWDIISAWARGIADDVQEATSQA